jgi:hypothetical protein
VPPDVVVELPLDSIAAEPTAPEEWPTLDSRALYGLAGDAVRLACAHSEADPAAVLAQFLARFGASISTGPHVRIGDAIHFLRLFLAIIGETAKARKGTSEKPVDRIYLAAEVLSGLAPLPVYRGGIGSGEGIVYAVRDPSEKQDKEGMPVDEGAADKRLLVIDEELAGTLRASAREGSTTSAILRQAWDKGDLGTLTKHNPTRATGAHICVPWAHLRSALPPSPATAGDCRKDPA